MENHGTDKWDDRTERKGNFPKIIVKKIVYKETPETGINMKKIVNLILGVDSLKMCGYNTQDAELCGVRENCDE